MHAYIQTSKKENEILIEDNVLHNLYFLYSCNVFVVSHCNPNKMN